MSGSLTTGKNGPVEMDLQTETSLTSLDTSYIVICDNPPYIHNKLRCKIVTLRCRLIVFFSYSFNFFHYYFQSTRDEFKMSHKILNNCST